MKLYTIGFTKKTAKQFFDLLKENKVNYLVDIRLHPDGQLAGFTKKEDLRYFLKELIDCEYRHIPSLAPNDELLKTYRKDHDWSKYEEGFERLMDQRGIPETLDRVLIEEKTCCLLCSEATPEKCHRRLVAERVAGTWEEVEIIHL
jgi:uncharacterized protein (DUF488 family)